MKLTDNIYKGNTKNSRAREFLSTQSEWVRGGERDWKEFDKEMEGEKKKGSSFGTSWADEVEREEKDEAAWKQRIEIKIEAETVISLVNNTVLLS